MPIWSNSKNRKQASQFSTIQLGFAGIMVRSSSNRLQWDEMQVVTHDVATNSLNWVIHLNSAMHVSLSVRLHVPILQTESLFGCRRRVYSFLSGEDRIRNFYDWEDEKNSIESKYSGNKSGRENTKRVLPQKRSISCFQSQYDSRCHRRSDMARSLQLTGTESPNRSEMLRFECAMNIRRAVAQSSSSKTKSIMFFKMFEHCRSQLERVSLGKVQDGKDSSCSYLLREIQIDMALISPVCERATYHLIIVSGQSKWKNIFSQERPVTISIAIKGLLTEDGLHGSWNIRCNCPPLSA